MSSAVSFAQARVPRFIGSPETQSAAFNSFIRRNVGRRVYLDLRFDENSAPQGYRDVNADPFFEAGPFTYLIDCRDDGNLRSVWTSRCRNLHYDSANRRLRGYFRVARLRKLDRRQAVVYLAAGR